MPWLPITDKKLLNFIAHRLHCDNRNFISCDFMQSYKKLHI